MSRLSVVLPSWNTRELLRSALCSLEPALPASSEVIVIDNASHDGSVGVVLREFPHVRVVRNERNEGFARAVNQAVAMTRGDFVLVLHPDAEFLSGSIRPMLTFLEQNERYAAVVPKVLNPDGSVQRNVGGLPSLATPLFEALERWWPSSRELERRYAAHFDFDSAADVDAVDGGCLLLRRTALRRDKPIDEDLWLYQTDLDLCCRLRKQMWRIRYLPEVVVFHHGQRSIRQHPDPLVHWHRDRMTYFRKHYGSFAVTWLKACTWLAFADQLIGELWRRAHGEEDVPLRGFYEQVASSLRAEPAR